MTPNRLSCYFSDSDRYTDIQKLFRQSSAFGNQQDYLGDVSALGASRLVNASSDLFRKSDDGVIQEHLQTLEALVANLSLFEAKEPHDTIYAILSLAQDTGNRFLPERGERTQEAPVAILHDQAEFTEVEKAAAQKVVKVLKSAVLDRYPVDYVKPFFDVCKDFMSFTFEKSESLDMICRPWAPARVADLPSWITSLNKSAYRPATDQINSRVNADTFVGLPANGKRNYNASRGKSVKGNWRMGSGNSHKSLFVKGFILDAIKIKKMPAQQGNVPSEWLDDDICEWSGISGEPPDRFWRTLVADRGPEGLNPQPYYQLACQHAFRQRASGDDLNTKALMMSDRTPQVVVEFLQRVQSAVWMRRLMLSAKGGYLGLAPKEAKKHDSICVLYGCSVPVLLRKVIGDERTGDYYYKFIGECYVHGMMDGEALR